MASEGMTTEHAAAAIDIRNKTLVMVVFGPPGDDGSRRVRTRSLRWRYEASSLRTAPGKQELAKALQTLVEEEGLAGASVNVTLDGQYCVTRVVTGSTEEVQRELASLRERSELYLSLGPERKMSAQSIQELDARHQHALLAVGNGETLDTVLQLAAEVDLKVNVIEPMLVALCRLLGTMGTDAEAPVLAINWGEGDMELGISYRGQLLLGYRTGEGETATDFGDIVARQLARLNRYCENYYRYTQGPITQVFVCGPGALLDHTMAPLKQQKHLTVRAIDPASINSQWTFVDSSPDPECCVALGTCLPCVTSETSVAGPNLANHSRADVSSSSLGLLFRRFWPAAAAAMLALALFSATWYERSRCRDLNRRIEGLETSVAELRRLRREVVVTRKKAADLRTIASETLIPPWADILDAVGHCMPEEVWLAKIATTPKGAVLLTGSSYREALIHEFGDYLEASPVWASAMVEGTRPAKMQSGFATRFDIQCELDNQEYSNMRAGRND